MNKQLLSKLKVHHSALYIANNWRCCIDADFPALLPDLSVFFNI